MRQSAFLILFLASFSVRAQNSTLERDSLRHLQEGWPRLQNSTPKASREEGASSRRVRGYYRNYLAALESTQAVLEQADKSNCQQGQLLAVQDLIQQTLSERRSLLTCKFGCRASELRFQKLHSLLYEFDEAVAECLRGSVTRAWLYEKQTQLKAHVLLEVDQFSNPSAQAVGASAESRQDSLIGTGLNFDYRGDEYWTGLEARGGIRFRKDSANKWPFFLKNDWIYQPSKHAFRFGGLWGRSFPYLNSTLPITEDLIAKNYAASFLWKLPLGDRSLGLGVEWAKETWSEDLWSRVQVKVTADYYLVERHRESVRLYASAAKIALKNSNNTQLWASRVGLFFEEIRSSSESSLLKLGIQDRRVKGSGASLWPEFEVAGVGPDLVINNIFPSWKLSVEPVETPWSLNTLRSQAEMGLRFSKASLNLPFKVAMGRDFHRSDVGGLRDDLILRLSLSPAYRVSSRVLIELPLEWQRYWILRSDRDPSTVLVPYPQNSYKAYEARLRLRYEF